MFGPLSQQSIKMDISACVPKPNAPDLEVYKTIGKVYKTVGKVYKTIGKVYKTIGKVYKTIGKVSMKFFSELYF